MKLSKFAKEESIGNPDLFCGRKKELRELLEWIDLIPQKQAKSLALMATKKMGKTAILDRLYNFLFLEQGPVIPFFFLIQEQTIWLKSFADQFYRSFLTQYLAFKLNHFEWVNQSFPLSKLNQLAEEHHLHVLLEDTQTYQELLGNVDKDSLWQHACGAPHRIAALTGDFFLQIIDEFQYLNEYIYSDEHHTKQINLAGSYHGLAESRIAPLLITGSMIGWLRDILLRMLNPRFDQLDLKPFPPGEALEAVYTYGKYFNTNLTEESSIAIQRLSQNHPYYISCIIRSRFPNKDLTTIEGVEKTLDYEVRHRRGSIYGQWMEYIAYAFNATNGQTAKSIILYLSQNRDQEKTRLEILEYLKRKGIEIDDEELEKKLQLLEKSDVIDSGSTAFRYRGIPDELFNRVFRLLYAEEIENVSHEETLEEIQKQNQAVREKSNQELFEQNKGYFLEYMFTRILKYQVHHKETSPLKFLLENAPNSARFVPYQTVGDFHFNLPDGRHHQFDVLARAQEETHPSLLIECKYYQKPISVKAVQEFAHKWKNVKKEIPNLIPIIYSVSGFTQPAQKKLKELQISWSTPKLWNVLKGA